MSNSIVGALLFVGGYTLGRVSKTLDIARETRARWTPNPNIDDADIEAAIRAKTKIEAIKLYRQRTGAGLKEAKQAVEAIAQRINVRL
ncbi:ribosomal protein L7/L12 [Rhodanobacter sp. ANJX3]|uniref:ribosomal protein L7/L12 n=1 Tax=Rhodanobacter sp. ANJX3 TaxID=2723083 RepID=UPI001798CE67|nr:ribosomal protein L7/L12 [Rhodanobacter sp. ANJX3]MBB5358411.1 ribosomal protein L7/L12 [Rhodanobacter sp. ANJX3]